MRIGTAFLLFATGVVWLAWELVTIYARQPGEGWATISVVMSNAALKSNALPFGVSLMIGHWWINWDRGDARAPFEAWPVWVVVLALLAIADAGVAIWAPARPTWPHWARVLRYPGIWVIVGIVLGPLTWPQRAPL